MDSGYWTLYRYDPRRTEKGANPFQLDSKKIKYDLMQFLGGQNRFEQLRRADTETAEQLQQGLQQEKYSRHDKFVKLAMDDYEMLEHLKKQLGEEVASGSVMVLYGSETGTAAGLAQVNNNDKGKDISIPHTKPIVLVCSNCGRNDGVISKDGMDFLCELESRITQSTHYHHESAFLFERLSE